MFKLVNNDAISKLLFGSILSGDEYPRTKIFNCRVKDLGIMLESVMSTEKTRPVFPIFEKAKRRRSSCNSRRRRKSSSPAPSSKKQRTQCWWDDLYEDYDPTEEEEKPLRRRTRSRSSSTRRTQGEVQGGTVRMAGGPVIQESITGATEEVIQVPVEEIQGDPGVQGVQGAEEMRERAGGQAPAQEPPSTTLKNPQGGNVPG